MTNLIRSNFQDHPFHLVTPSPWPLFTSVSLFNLATSGALSMHNFHNGYYLNYVGSFLLVLALSFWLRDIIWESYLRTLIYSLRTVLFNILFYLVCFLILSILFFPILLWSVIKTLSDLVKTISGVIGGTKPMPPIFIPEPWTVDISFLTGFLLFHLGKNLWQNRPEIWLDLTPSTIRLSDGTLRSSVNYLGEDPISKLVFKFLFLGDPRLTYCKNTCPIDDRHYPLFYANSPVTYPPLALRAISLPFINDGVWDYHISTVFPSPLRANWGILLAAFRLEITTGYDDHEIVIRPNWSNIFSMELRSYHSVSSIVTQQYPRM